MRITEGQLRSFIRESILLEVGGSEYSDARIIKALSDKGAQRAIGQAVISSGEAAIDFTKSLGELALDTIIYFKTGQYLLDSVKGMTGTDLTPDSQKEWRSTIAAASLHDFLDKFGTAGFEPADLINAAVYMLEKNWKMAALCSIAAIPAVGGLISKSKIVKPSVAGLKALDAELTGLKTGLRATGRPGANTVVEEVDNIRRAMSESGVDFSATRERRADAAAVAEKKEELAKAAKELNDVLESFPEPAGSPARAGLSWIKNPMSRSKLYTLSNRPIKGVYDTVAQLRPGRKPVGLWIARGDDWITHLSAGYVDPRLMDATHVYEVNIKSASSDLQKSGGILILKNEAEVAEFTRRYGMTTAGNEPAINWPEVAKRYDGIALLDDASYAQTGWRWGWDLESICVWRSTAIESMTTFATKNQ